MRLRYVFSCSLAVILLYNQHHREWIKGKTLTGIYISIWCCLPFKVKQFLDPHHKSKTELVKKAVTQEMELEAHNIKTSAWICYS